MTEQPPETVAESITLIAGHRVLDVSGFLTSTDNALALAVVVAMTATAITATSMILRIYALLLLFEFADGHRLTASL